MAWQRRGPLFLPVHLIVIFGAPGPRCTCASFLLGVVVFCFIVVFDVFSLPRDLGGGLLSPIAHEVVSTHLVHQPSSVARFLHVAITSIFFSAPAWWGARRYRRRRLGCVPWFCGERGECTPDAFSVTYYATSHRRIHRNSASAFVQLKPASNWQNFLTWIRMEVFRWDPGPPMGFLLQHLLCFNFLTAAGLFITRLC